MIRHRLAALGLVLLCATSSAHAQARYPARTIEVVVPYGPGGSTDVIARQIVPKFQDRLGQSVVILNRPGASGAIGATSVARAAPDGYTLLASFTTEIAVVPQTSKNAKYSLDDFDPIAVSGIVPLVLIGAKSLRANTLSELIAEMRAAPGKFTYAGSPGSPSHITGAWLNRIRNLNVTHIPYRGGAQAVGDVVGGHVDLLYAGISAAKGVIDSGHVKTFAQTGDHRSSALPDVPTFKEAGVTDFDLDSWTTLLAPKGTPTDIIALLKGETDLALSDPQIRAYLASQGVEPSPKEDARVFLARERDKFARVIRELNITMD
jgi:tripartite-type tricarboxylate transporter receptor subunit TctC